MTRSAISTSTAVCVLLATLSASVRADLTAFWRHNPITPQAIADDPALAGMQSWSAMITNTDGLWASAGLRAVLPAGLRFYRHPTGGLFRPTISQQNTNPALAFHTYLTDPTQSLVTGSGAPVILGGFPELGEQYSLGGASDAIPGTLAVAWGDPQGPPIHSPATYEIARLTFTLGVVPEIHAQSQTSQVSPDQTVPIPTVIPEPTLLVATAPLALARRRRRSHARR